MGRPVAAWPSAVLAVAAIGVAVATVVALRPILPVDETRYLSVAWEMWWRDAYLVPHLNGEPYAHKPPLLFWLINLAWSVTGVSSTTARLVPAAFALGTLAVTGWLGRMLWPDDDRSPPTAAVMLVGMPLFLTFATLVMFDVPLAFFTTLGTAAVVALARGGGFRWWLLFAVSIGLGILTKGPVALVFLLPAPLLAPLWWLGPRTPDWRRWYVACAVAVLGGGAIVLAWLVPAVIAGGDDYAGRILWRQTAARVAGGLGHPRPFWFYLAVVPLVLYPWGWVPSAWRGAVARLRVDPPVRFCLCASLAPFLILSVVHGKQVHYLIPAMPVVALLLARGLSLARARHSRADSLLPLLPLAAVSLCLLASPLIVALLLETGAPEWLTRLSPLWGIALLAAAIGPAVLVAALRRPPTEGFAAATGVVFLVVHLAGSVSLFDIYDLRAVSAYLGARQQMPIAYDREYHGEFGFLARLVTPVHVVYDSAMPSWIARHPDGLIVSRYKKRPSYLAGAPEVEAQYRGHRIGVWLARSAAAAAGSAR